MIYRRCTKRESHGFCCQEMRPNAPYVHYPDRYIEEPLIYARDGQNYLFINWDQCCMGDERTYNIRIGRARDIKEGTALREGVGSLFRRWLGDWKIPQSEWMLMSPRDQRFDHFLHSLHPIIIDKFRPQWRHRSISPRCISLRHTLKNLPTQELATCGL